MSGRRRSADLPPAGGSGGPPGGGGGWRYTLRVPSWSQAQLPDGETAVFYQVGAWDPGRRSLGRSLSPPPCCTRFLAGFLVT